MNKLYINTFELIQNADTKRDFIVSFIKSGGAYKQLLNNVYCLITNRALTERQIRDIIKPSLDTGDRLFIVECTKHWPKSIEETI